MARSKNFKEIKLKNGLKVILVKDPSLPKITYQMLIQVGNLHGKPGLEGQNALVASLLDQGTTKRSARSLSDEFGFYGTEIHQNPSYDYTEILVSGLSKDKGPLLELFGDVILNPAFQMKDINRVKSEILSQIKNLPDHPGSYSDLSINEEIFGQHPYGKNIFGNLNSVKAISRTDLLRFYFSFYRPNNSILGISGDFNDDFIKKIQIVFENWQVKEINSSRFKTLNLTKPDPSSSEDSSSSSASSGSSLSSGAPAAASDSAAPVVGSDSSSNSLSSSNSSSSYIASTSNYNSERDTLSIKVYNKSDLQQSEIRISQLGIKRTDPDYLAIKLAFHALGGDFMSRLNQKIRDKKALTYSIEAHPLTALEGGSFLISTATSHEKVGETLNETLSELRDFITKGLNEKEFETNKKILISQFPLSIETADQWAFRLMILRRYQLKDSEVTDYIENLKNLSLSEVNAAIKKNVLSDNWKVLIYGNSDLLKSQLSNWSKVDYK